MSNISHLLGRFADGDSVKKLAAELQKTSTRIQLNGLTGAQESFVLAAISQSRIPFSSFNAEDREAAASLNRWQLW